MSQITSVTFGLLAATKPKSSSLAPLLIIVAFGAVAYFLFLRPQQQKAKKAREEGKSFEVGDEILTVGGIVGRVLDINDDRVTIVTGETAEEGSLPEYAPHRMVIVRQAVARKLEPSSPEHDDDHDDEHDEHDDAATEDESGDESEEGSGK